MPPFRTQQPKAVRIWWDSQVQAYRLQAPYEPALVETLKTAIVSSQRSYDPASKIWTFTEGYLDAVVKLCEKLFAGAKPQVITRAQVEAAQAPPPSGSGSSAMKPANSVIAPLLNEFFEVVPYDAMRRAYLAAASALHPDHGGDMEKATRLNAAWQRLEKEFYLKKKGE